MKSNKKKVIGITLVIIIAISLFAGCGQRTEENTAEEVNESEVEICQTDYTRIAYVDGFYYYQSAADYFYLYRAKDDGKDTECLAEDVVKELYVLEDWVYFTNLSKASALYRVKTDGSMPGVVCNEQIDRFFPIGETFYCMSEEENGTNKIFACTTDGEIETLYEGKCYWISTDGEFLYLEIREEPPMADDEAPLQTVVMDREGNILLDYQYLNQLLPTKHALYYLDSNFDEEGLVWEIIRRDKETEKVCRYEVPGNWTNCCYAIQNEKLYVLCHSSQEYVFLQYDEESGTFLALCPYMEIAGEHTLFDKVENAFYLLNDKIFVKIFVEDGKGELWHSLALTGGDVKLFEDMEEPVSVDTSWHGVFRQNAFYREGYLGEDIEYSEEVDDGQGYVISTMITVPQIASELPAAGIINQKIKEDVEQFHKERGVFHEAAKINDIELETSYGEFTCAFAYAGGRYVSIVYEKHLTTNSNYTSEWEYITRLYSSETGEELQPEELFTISPDQLFLRLSFLIRKTESVFDYFSEDLFFREGTHLYYRTYYCLTDEGLDVFFVEDMRTFKEDHFIISYGELEDIFTWSNTVQSNLVESETIDEAELLGWQTAYAEYIKGVEYAQYNKYALIYVDEDDIPELVIYTGTYATACIVLTFHNGEVDALQTGSLQCNYIEKKNILLDAGGQMGEYFNHIYSIENGKWCYVAGAKYIAKLDDDGLITDKYDYEWQGEAVSEDIYSEKLGEIWDWEQNLTRNR